MAVLAHADQVVNEFGGVNIVVNNGGVALAGDGHVANISSVSGLIEAPTQSAYNSAKFAVRGFTEALRHRVKIEYSDRYTSA